MFREKARPAEEPADRRPAFDPMAGGFPVPPLPGQELPPVPRRRPRRERELIVSGGSDTVSDGTSEERRRPMAEEPQETGRTEPGFQNPVAGFGVTFKAMFRSG